MEGTYRWFDQVVTDSLSVICASFDETCFHLPDGSCVFLREEKEIQNKIERKEFKIQIRKMPSSGLYIHQEDTACKEKRSMHCMHAFSS